MKTTDLQHQRRKSTASNAPATATYWFAGLLLSGIAALVAGERSGLKWLTAIGCCLCFASSAAMLIGFHRSGVILSNRGQSIRSANPLRFRIGIRLSWVVWVGALLAIVLHSLGYV